MSAYKADTPFRLFEMSYCAKCGRKQVGAERFCPNCGNSFLQTANYQSEPSGTNTSYIWCIVLFSIGILIWGTTYYSKESHWLEEAHSIPSSIFNIPKSQGQIQAIKSIEEMKMALNNTIWTHTKRGNLFWLKLEFKKDKVRIYKAFPSDGQWTFEEECSYFLEEGRFIDDGRRYIAAVIESKDMSIPPKFVITNGHLSWLGFIDAGGFVLGDYEWD